MIVDAEYVSGEGLELEGDELDDESKKDDKAKYGCDANIHDFNGLLHLISIELSIGGNNSLDIMLVDDRKAGVPTLKGLFDVSHIVYH